MGYFWKENRRGEGERSDPCGLRFSIFPGQLFISHGQSSFSTRFHIAEPFDLDYVIHSYKPMKSFFYQDFSGWNIWLLLLKDLYYQDFIDWITLSFFYKQTVYKQLKSWPRYFRQTLVFLWNSTLREKFNFYFSRILG